MVYVTFKVDMERAEIEEKVSYQFEQEALQHRLGKGKSVVHPQKWIDRIVADKLKVRGSQNLTTEFEVTRLRPPAEMLPESVPADLSAPSVPAQLEVDEGPKAPPVGPAPLPGSASLSLDVLLANTFDAADEASEGLLSHREVSDLLFCIPSLGLEDWDIRRLLSTARENDDGYIDYLPFVQDAVNVINALRERRARYVARGLPACQLSEEAIELCFGEELEETARVMKETFELMDPSGAGVLKRADLRAALESRPERFSPQEVALLLQVMTADEHGNVSYDHFSSVLYPLRRDSFHNALVESDVRALRKLLINLLHSFKMPPDFKLPIWTIRELLCEASQICLSRMQIHVLLCVLRTDAYGDVDCREFLSLACTAIPYFCDTEIISSKAEMILKERTDAAARAELEELQGLTGGIKVKAKGQIDDEDSDEEKAAAPDKESVSKGFIHKFNLLDDKHRGTVDVGILLQILRHAEDSAQRFSEVVAQSQLTDAELRGFVAEAEVDESSEVAYVEHVKTWIPIVFELRQSRIYEATLNEEWTDRVDLSIYEEADPLVSLAVGAQEEDEEIEGSGEASDGVN